MIAVRNRMIGSMEGTVVHGRGISWLSSQRICRNSVAVLWEDWVIVVGQGSCKGTAGGLSRVCIALLLHFVGAVL